jgi:hypothetical protein
MSYQVNNAAELAGALVAITDLSNSNFDGYLFGASDLGSVIIDGATVVDENTIRVYVSTNLTNLFDLRQKMVKGTQTRETNFHSNTFLNLDVASLDEKFVIQLMAYAEDCVGKFRSNGRLELAPGNGAYLMKLKANGPAARVMLQFGECTEVTVNGETSQSLPSAAFYLADVSLERTLGGTKTEISMSQVDFSAFGFTMPAVATKPTPTTALKPLSSRPAIPTRM